MKSIFSKYCIWLSTLLIVFSCDLFNPENKELTVDQHNSYPDSAMASDKQALYNLIFDMKLVGDLLDTVKHDSAMNIAFLRELRHDNLPILDTLIRYYINQLQQVKIFGGTCLDRCDEIPWQVGIYKTNNPKVLWAGGIIIDEKWILTAGHVVGFLHYSDFFIRSGSHIIGQGKRINLKNIVLKNGYGRDGDLLVNDLALLELKNPIKLRDSSCANKIRLPSSASDIWLTHGNPAIVSGWGKSDNISCPDILKKGKVSFARYDSCKGQYPDLKEYMVCTGGGVETCNGDSGGPLFIFDKQKRPLLVGVTSQGYKLCGGGYYRIFTRTDKFINWIDIVLKTPPVPLAGNQVNS